MSKNTRPENLAKELMELPKALDAVSMSRSGNSVILARMIRGVSPEDWTEASRSYALGNWHALPVDADSSEGEEDLQLNYGGVLRVTPFREVPGALTRSMFSSLLQRELLRLSRNGGAMSVVAATLSGRKEVVTALGAETVDRLDELLGVTLLDRLEACDALGLPRRGIFMCSLPGMGQLAARRFAESVQKAFAAAARPFFPLGGLSAGNGGDCAMGIVNLMQGEASTVTELLKRARASLETALRKETGHIHQESAKTPFEGTTLVHSSEKRFLFFGGDPS